MDLHRSISIVLVIAVLCCFPPTVTSHGVKLFREDKVMKTVYGLPSCNATERADIRVNDQITLPQICNTKTKKLKCSSDGGKFEDCEIKLTACFSVYDFIKLVLEESYQRNYMHYQHHTDLDYALLG